jgi:hypothetical protein
MGAKQGTVTKLPGQNYGNGANAKGSADSSRLTAAYASSPLGTIDQLNDDGS